MKRKALRKVFVIFIILAIIVGIGIVYLNQVILPVKIKSLIIQSLERETRKKVTLDSVRFNIFKGLVLKNLALYDGPKAIINLKEASCTFHLLSLLIGKGVILPTVRLESPIIFLERRSDNTFNLLDLFPKGTASTQKKKFGILVYRIGITNARIDFKDSYLSPAFTKSIEDLNLDISLSLPVSIKFNLKAKLPAKPTLNLGANGEFNLPEKQLTAKITIKDLNPKEFLPYYRNLGLLINEGLIDSLINLKFKKDNLSADLETQNRNLTLSKNKIMAKLNSSLKANLQYNLKDKQLISISGNLDLTRMDIAGIEKIDRIDNISGRINFNQNGLNSEKGLKGEIFGIKCEGKLNLADFKSPLLGLNLNADLNFNAVRKILADNYKIVLPLDLMGTGKLKLNLEFKFLADQAPKIEGVLDIIKAEAKIDKIKTSLTNISGTIDFDLNQIRWKKLNFDYAGNTYSSYGILENFKKPDINLELSSSELFLASNLKIKDKLINVSFLKGEYLNSKFDFKGTIDAASNDSLPVEISAQLNLNLRDIKKPLAKFKDILEKIKPEGILRANLNIEGNIRDFKSLDIQAKFNSPSLSVYSLWSQEFSMVYNQTNGLADIPLIHLYLYDGIIAANAKLNLAAQNLPYLLNVNTQGIKIEKLKLDTPAKNKEISGTIQAQAKINGFLSNFSKLSGAGKILVNEGKLWQLNLFQGLGQLLFTQDFANIIFSQGSCDFFIQNKFILTDNLSLISNLVRLAGQVKIGFDSSIDGSINVQMSDEIVPETGRIKEITSVILGHAGRFAVVKLSGTLQQPKYKFQPAVVDVIKSLKDLFFGK